MKNSGRITISIICKSQASTNKNLQQEPNFQLCSSVIFVKAFSTVLFFSDKGRIYVGITSEGTSACSQLRLS